MNNRAEPKHLFMVLGISLFLFSPILVIFSPLIIGETIYFDRNNWIIYLPKINFILNGLSILLMVIALVVLWLKGLQKSSIAIALLFAVGSIVVFYGASMSFVTLSNDEVTFRQPFAQEKQIYSWEEIDNVTYFDNQDNLEAPQYFMIFFQDRKELKLVQNGILDVNTKIKIDSKIRSHKIPFEVIQQ